MALKTSAALKMPVHQYFAKPEKKDLVIWHWTGGWKAEHATQTWNASALQEGTAYVLERDGTVFNTFDENGWAYHLGVAGLIGDKHDRRSIGIEVVSVGPLTLKGDVLQAYGSKVCTLAEKDKYVRVPGGFRGVEYFQAFTPAQIAALTELTAEICTRHSIPMQFPPLDRRGIADLAFFAGYRGVCSHINFRGKTAMGGWDRWDCPPYVYAPYEVKGKE